MNMRWQVAEAFGVGDPRWSNQVVRRDDFSITPEPKSDAPLWIYVICLRGARRGEYFEIYLGTPLRDPEDVDQVASAERKVLTALLTNAKEA